MQAEGRSFSGYERHCVFLNTASSRFANVSATSGLDLLDDGRGIAYVDWDADGDLDLWISNRTAPQVRFLRNDTPTENHFVAVHLTGRTSNRDAIGARVELYLRNASPGKLAKTLYAGHGFLSQSSKWLHFGLGRNTDVDRIVVNWPGGAAETFTDLHADQRYHIVQGSGTAEQWIPPNREIVLKPSRLQGTPATSTGNLFLAVRAPIPELSYQDFTNNTISLNERIDRPTLINLWAAWCGPCHAELKEWSEHEEQFHNAGLRVIALSVDGLDENQTTDPSNAQQTVNDLNLRFDVGLANPDLLTKLQMLNDVLIYRRIPLQVPTSFLIDSDGQLAGIYRGRVSAERLLRDVAHLDDSPDQRRSVSLPFSGRWVKPQNPLRLDVVARTFNDRGFLSDAVVYLREAVRLRPNISSVHLNLGIGLWRLGKAKEAFQSLRQALQLDPANVDAHYNLAVGLQLQGKLDESIIHYRLAVKHMPDFVRAYNNLGHALLAQAKNDEAIRTFRQILAIDSDFAKAHYNLGNALHSVGETEEAIRHYQEALRLEPDFAPTRLHLGNALLAQGHLDNAIAEYRHAVALEADDAVTQYSLAVALTMQGKMTDAYRHFQEAVRLEPEWPEALNGLAWILATHPDATVRQPKRALDLARKAADLTSHQEMTILDTLASSFAANGQFDRAVSIAKTAHKLATEAADQSLADQIRQRLELFAQEKPYREVAEEH